MSSLTCDHDVTAWLTAVRAELTAAFEREGHDVPADVAQLGEPMYMAGRVLLDAEGLWSDLADPPSFVTRVSVRATRPEDAIARAHRALRAVFGQTDQAIASDIRPDSRVWTEEGGWHLPSVTASGRSRGEIYAARTAARAVDRWAADVGAALDAGSVERLEARALIRNPAAPPGLRLLRAFIALEALARAGSRIESAAGQLWLFSAWEQSKRSLANVLYDVALEPINIGPLRPGVARDATRDRIEALRLRMAEMPLPWNMKLFDVVDRVMTDVHSEAMSRLFVESSRAELHDPRGLAKAKSQHQAAWGRVRRHRNLVAHGWAMDDEVLAPTVAFLAEQVEIGIVASDKDRETRALPWLGSLDTEPDEQWAERTAAELLDEIATRGTD